MEMKLSLGEIITIITVLAQGIGFFMRFESRLVRVEEKISSIEETLHESRAKAASVGA